MPTPLNTDCEYRLPCHHSCAYSLDCVIKLLLYRRGITLFLRETVGGSEKSWLVITDVQNDDFVRFCDVILSGY